MKRWLVFDTETTGLLLPSSAALNDQPRIIEFALREVICQYHEDTGEPKSTSAGKEHVWLINPGQSLSAEITKITGLTDADLEGKPSFGEVLPEIINVFLGAHGLIAHNMPFDMGMLTNELKLLGREFAFPYPPKQLCTVSSSLHLKGHRMRMVELYEHCLGKPLAQTHRALDDVNALVEILFSPEFEGALE